MNQSVVSNAADSKQVRNGARNVRIEAQQRVDDLRFIMSDERGRRFIWAFLSDARIFHTTFTGEALSTAFNEGMRNCGCELMTRIMRDCPNLYQIMADENTPDEDVS